MKKLGVFTFAALVAFMFSACTGPAGPAGADGPQGPAGVDGTNGTNGVANINIQVVDVTAWSFNASPAYYYATFTDGSITDPNQEAVEVYFSAASNSGPWQFIPGSNLFNSGDQLTASWTTNTVTFFYDFSSLTNVPADVYFNVAVIPPAIMKKYPNTNWKDGKAVLQLPEMQAAMQAAHKQ